MHIFKCWEVHLRCRAVAKLLHQKSLLLDYVNGSRGHGQGVFTLPTGTPNSVVYYTPIKQHSPSYFTMISWSQIIHLYVYSFRCPCVRPSSFLVNTISNERMVRFQPNLVWWCVLWCSRTLLKVDTLDQHLTYFFIDFRVKSVQIIVNTITTERVVGFQPNLIWRCISSCSRTLLKVYTLDQHLTYFCVLSCSRTTIDLIFTNIPAQSIDCGIGETYYSFHKSIWAALQWR